MTPVWQCIGIVVWPWVLAGGKGHLHHRVTFFFFNRKISSNWVGCFLIPLKISLNFLYSLCVCIHMYMLCAHQVFMLTGPRPTWLYTLFLWWNLSLTWDITLVPCCLLPALGSQVHSAIPAFLMCAGHPNLGPYVCSMSSVPTQPSYQA